VPADAALVSEMDRVRDVCSAGSSIRKARGLRVRLPLASLTVAAPWADSLERFRELIADEVNVRSVVLTDAVDDHGHWVLSLVPAVLGPRVGADVQKLIGAVKAGKWERRVDGTVAVLDRVLADDEYTLRLTPTDESVSRPLDGGLVVLDVTADPSLEAEGTARDVIRLVQNARKNAGLNVSDRIELAIVTSPEIATALDAHRARLADAVLAVSVSATANGAWDHVEDVDLDDTPLRICLRRA
jgi:isoleucyl-tRNA synthetase